MVRQFDLTETYISSLFVFPGEGFWTLVDSGDLPYCCDQCGRTYRHQATMTRHQRYECGIAASYPCQLCGRKFKRRDVLKGHLEKCMGKPGLY